MLCVSYRGGLGLTGGIADIGSLTDCFYGYVDGKASLKIFEKYDECRRAIYNNITNPTSTINMERMRKNGQTVLDEDDFLQYIKNGSVDPNFAADFLMVSRRHILNKVLFVLRFRLMLSPSARISIAL